MSIENIKFGLNSIKPIQQPEIQKTPDSKQAPGMNSFGDMLSQAVKDVNSMQLKADQQIEGVMLQKEGVNVHDAMIALEKADIAFQMMNMIRSKIIRAYQEVMRTPI